MAYEPTNWKTGDVITAEKLNKLETAVPQVFKVNAEVSSSAVTLDASYNDIVAAFEAGKIVLLAVEDDMEPGIYLILYLAGYSMNSFIVYFFNPSSGTKQFSADTADEPLLMRRVSDESQT